MNKQQLNLIQDMLFERAGIEKDHKKAELCFECMDKISLMLKDIDHGRDNRAKGNR